VSLKLFEQVRRGEVSSEDAAEQIMVAREAEKPAWVPLWVFKWFSWTKKKS